MNVVERKFCDRCERSTTLVGVDYNVFREFFDGGIDLCKDCRRDCLTVLEILFKKKGRR
jgi:hypothetical protein